MSEYFASAREMQDNLIRLSENPYPGRGIILGINSRGDEAQQVYWIMGRSENSRNRLLVEEQDVVKTVPFDESKVTDPSLIIYNAMRISGNTHVVSNGDQTDTIVEFLENGLSFDEALQTRTYEPDYPNFTPRISGFIEKLQKAHANYGLSIIRRGFTTGEPLRNTTRSSLQADYHKGGGYCLHTYKDDGDPLPAFSGIEYPVPMGETAEETAEMYWDRLNLANRVALVTKGIKLATSEISYHIINAHEQEEA
jgi:IMP cyclohydrolase